MVTTIKGEKYLSIEECIEKLYTFTKGKIKLDKQHFVALIKTYKNQGIDFKTLKYKMHLRLDVFENLMMGANGYDFINRAMNLYEKQIGYKEQVVAEPSYANDENDMEKYSDNLINKYQFEGKKTVRINEGQLKRIFENFTDEGGVFYVKNMGHGRGERNDKYLERIKNIDADYRYVDDVRDQKKDNKNVYVDFSQSGLKTHPRNPNWVQYPWSINNTNDTNDEESEGEEVAKKTKYETLDNKNPRNPKKFDTIVKGYDGKYYMPTRQNFGQGDNVKMIKQILHLGNNQQVICYNLSSLGVGGGSTATMMAHFYKGKDINYKNGVTLRGRGYENLNGYLKNVISVIKSEDNLYNFNPDFIIYPESSSSFNGTISTLLKRFIFKNAEIKPNGWIKKIGTWGYDYEDLFILTNNEAKKMQRRYKSDSYTRLLVYSYISHCKDLLVRKFENEIYDIVSKYGKESSIIERNEKIYDAMTNLFMQD